MTPILTVAVGAFGVSLTVGAYALSLRARKYYASPLTTPVLFSTVIVIAVLLATGISFEDYGPAKRLITALLGPATVALALPLYRNRQVFFRNLLPAAFGLIAGSLGTMIVAALIARAFALAPDIVSSIAIKSATVPIAVEIARLIQANPALTAIFVVVTGMIGAAFGPWLLDRARITHPLSRGLALVRSRTDKAPHKQPPRASLPVPSLVLQWVWGRSAPP
jgi:putative effector of murein hydrolase